MCRSSNELTNTASKIQDDAGTTGCRRLKGEKEKLK